MAYFQEAQHLRHDESSGEFQTDFPLDELISHFSFYKGIGKKTAQRLALETIMLSPDKVQLFASSLVQTKKNIANQLPTKEHHNRKNVRSLWPRNGLCRVDVGC